MTDANGGSLRYRRAGALHRDSLCAAVINLPVWSTLTSEHGPLRATTRHHQEATISALTSINVDRSRPLNI
jgi:hypothetical protein